MEKMANSVGRWNNGYFRKPYEFLWQICNYIFLMCVQGYALSMSSNQNLKSFLAWDVLIKIFMDEKNALWWK